MFCNRYPNKRQAAIVFGAILTPLSLAVASFAKTPWQLLLTQGLLKRLIQMRCSHPFKASFTQSAALSSTASQRYDIEIYSSKRFQSLPCPISWSGSKHAEDWPTASAFRWCNSLRQTKAS